MFRATLAVALVCALGVRADAPKADLSDLKDAVRAADKRGANVESIKTALAALEKAMGTGATATDAAPPELAALRDAVEAAFKKGERVGGISDELGVVEKALTGKAFERPKGPEQKLEPEPEFPAPRFPNRGGFPGRRPGVVIGGGGGVVIGGGAFNSTAITIANGAFTIRAKRGDVHFVITGTADGAKPKIEITDGDTKTETDDPAKVPEKHKASVEQLLKMVNR